MTQELHLLHLRHAVGASAGLLDLVSFTTTQFGLSYTSHSIDEETRMSRDLFRFAAARGFSRHWEYTAWSQKR